MKDFMKLAIAEGKKVEKDIIQLELERRRKVLKKRKFVMPKTYQIPDLSLLTWAELSAK